MRLMTPSDSHIKGLQSIIEAPDDAPQEVLFCVPLEVHEAMSIRTLNDFKKNFKHGISSKIINSGLKKEIFLKLDDSFSNNADLRFVTAINNYEISFYVSDVNFEMDSLLNAKDKVLDISHFYVGSYFKTEFNFTRFLILQPDWRQLDDLYKNDRVLFSDYK